MKLERRRIIEAAFVLLDEVGIEKMSLRALARSLDVQPMSLYWHIKDKRELLRAMAGEIFGRAHARTAASEDPWTWLRHYGRHLRDEMIVHGDSARLIAISQPEVTGETQEAYARLAAPLVRAGLPLAQALACEACTISYVLGWVMFYQNDAYRAHLAGHFEFPASFEMGLDALVSGLRGSGA